MSVAPFKVGPDFIDPGHHALVAGRPSRNLDGWMLDRAYNRDAFQRHAHGCDVAVVEGVMGLFDGFGGADEAGSTAQMSKWLDLPVLLVVSAASMARSAAALVQGFASFDPQVRLAGVVFNHLGSRGHLDYIKEAMDAYVRTPLMGGLVRNDLLRMPERHLGLTTAEDRPLSSEQIDVLADHIESGIDMDRLLEHLPEVQTVSGIHLEGMAPDAPMVRLGVARDQAFCFYYPDNLEWLASAGVQLVYFSPLTDGRPPEDLDGLYFGGGYPELHAKRLAENRTMRETIQRLCGLGMPIYAECGGFMYLCRELEILGGARFPMCGCFPYRTRMHERLRTLGYREVKLNTDTLLGCRGRTMRGHEFHYSDLIDTAGNRMEQAYTVTSRKGGQQRAEGHVIHRTLGSYIHLHFGSDPRCVRAIADVCRVYQIKRRDHHATS
jgi:cobyrinic acid a,c-diamide synthase